MLGAGMWQSQPRSLTETVAGQELAIQDYLMNTVIIAIKQKYNMLKKYTRVPTMCKGTGSSLRKLYF